MQEKLKTLCTNEKTYRMGQHIYHSGHIIKLWLETSTLCSARVDTPFGQRRVILNLDNKGFPTSGVCSRCAPAGGEQFCEHMVAVALALEPRRHQEGLDQRRQAQAATELLAFFEQPILRQESLELELNLQLDDDGPARIALRVGSGRLYVVRDVLGFLDRYFAGEEISFSKNASIEAAWQCFSQKDEELLRFFHGIARSRRLAANAQLPSHEKSLALTDEELCGVLENRINQPFCLLEHGRSRRLMGVLEDEIEANVSFSSIGNALNMRVALPPGFQKVSRDGRFVRTQKGILALPEEQAAGLLPLMGYGEKFSCRFTREEGERLLSELIPHIGQAAHVHLDDALKARIERGELRPRIMLDSQGSSVVAKVEFQYGERVFDPFSPRPVETGERLVLRDGAGERRVLDMLESYGFLVRPGHAHLSGMQDIYAFLVDGVERLNEVAEVFCTKTLLGLRPRRIRFQGGMQLGRRGLEFDLRVEDCSREDKQAILQALLERKKYVRLQDGRFLSMLSQDGWDEASRLLMEADQIEEGLAIFQQARATYLPGLVRDLQLDVELDQQIERFTAALLSPEKQRPPIKGLRPYQRRGFHWMYALYKGNMGGVLADDMGLGKTVQVLALLLQGKLEAGQSVPSLVVAPTSLVYNWQAEIERFTPKLKCRVLFGDRHERRRDGENLDGVDVLIISYAQLRRDIEWLEERQFRMIVLDEAQQIKNASSIGAGAARRLQGQARFALSGTPIENHLGELWSIFDFCLPGYLSDQLSFMQSYEGGENAEQLRLRLKPFLLRRVKTDVLKELPDKVVEQIVAPLVPEQQEVYDATLQKARQLVEQADKDGALSRSNFQVLAALTRMRQICCHPSLCFENYIGGSGKLELCMDLVSTLVSGRHRILLFSQFTSMLSIVKKAMEDEGIHCMYLDGSTQAKDRLELVDRFNKGEGDVFLISLRAGGFGLNLTSADTVIHYDPWWNPAVENQATDRAHRIGQEKSVSVFKLIARNTIEEKVAQLQASKQALMDAVLQPGEAVPEGMSADEIRMLFE